MAPAECGKQLVEHQIAHVLGEFYLAARAALRHWLVCGISETERACIRSARTLYEIAVLRPSENRPNANRQKLGDLNEAAHLVIHIFIGI